MEVAPLSMIIESSQNFRYVTDFKRKNSWQIPSSEPKSIIFDIEGLYNICF